MKTIYILDFGGQYAHLIASRLRSFEVFSEIRDADTKASELVDAAGVILSGGPQSVFDPQALKVDSLLFELDVPILTICYGHQLLCHMLGGEVKEGGTGEYGPSTFLVKDTTSPLLKNIKKSSTVWMSHRDEALRLPDEFETIGSTEMCQHAAIAHTSKPLFGVQFHPEVTHTEEGTLLLKNFVDLTGASGTWKISDFITEKIRDIQEKTTGGKKVFLLVSGGVDSTVAFALLEKALPQERVFGLFIDTGLMRKDERKEVTDSLEKAGFGNLHSVDASDQFLKNLKGVTGPEEKRRIIGQTFLQVQQQALKESHLDPDEWILAQGTIYPDTIESGGTKNAEKIKTHHNRIPEIEEMIEKGTVIEPLSELYKDEVRVVGEQLGLASELVWRHPFPGPGLGVRILCSQGEKNVPNVEKIEQRIEKVTSCVSKVLPVKSVGVQGDARTYRHPVALFDAPRDWDALMGYAIKIINEEKEINRVLFSLFGTGTESFQIHPSCITPKRIEILQEADDMVRKELLRSGWEKKVWQFPVVLAPLSTDASTESIILRPVHSEEAMTAEACQLPWEVLERMGENLLTLPDISEVFYDLTHKPPGTIEWE